MSAPPPLDCGVHPLDRRRNCGLTGDLRSGNGRTMPGETENQFSLNRALFERVRAWNSRISLLTSNGESTLNLRIL